MSDFQIYLCLECGRTIKYPPRVDLFSRELTCSHRGATGITQSQMIRIWPLEVKEELEPKAS